MSDTEELNDVDDAEVSLMSTDFLKLIKRHTDDQSSCLEALKPWFVLTDGEDDNG
ncbi:hypothetical protein [Pseudomonas sp. DWP3-1-2]|uniref:hypothetical protein n=1 Tax=Pseudomonas sp. DWP3-1-2 TaxID=2804645 RepID=UPI003CF7A3D1